MRYVRDDRNFKLTSYNRLCEINEEFKSKVKVPNNIYYTQITSIEKKGIEKTYDIEISDNHHYIANSLVTHNSRRGAGAAVLSIEHPDIIDFIFQNEKIMFFIPVQFKLRIDGIHSTVGFKIYNPSNLKK